MDLLEFINESVVISDQLGSSPCFVSLKGRAGKDVKRFQKELKYIFFVYSRKSIYFDTELEDRKKLVCTDRLECSATDYESFDKDDLINECANYFIERQYSKSERLLNGIDGKIDEYLEFYRKTKISEENHHIVAQAVKNASDLIDLKDKLQKKVMNEKNIRQQGGGESKMFED